MTLIKNLCRVDQRTTKRATECKINGITLNYENSKGVNFTLRDMILADTAPVHIHNPKRSRANTVVSYPNRNKGVHSF